MPELPFPRHFIENLSLYEPPREGFATQGASERAVERYHLWFIRRYRSWLQAQLVEVEERIGEWERTHAD